MTLPPELINKITPAGHTIILDETEAFAANAMIKNVWPLVVLAISLPASLPGQNKPAENTAERIIVTAPPLTAPSKPTPRPKAVNEPVISKDSEKAVHIVAHNLVPVGSNMPLVITYYKGFAWVRNSPQEVPVNLVPFKGRLYAVLHMPGIPSSIEVVKLGVYKD